MAKGMYFMIACGVLKYLTKKLIDCLQKERQVLDFLYICNNHLCISIL